MHGFIYVFSQAEWILNIADLDQSYCLTNTLKETTIVCSWQFYATMSQIKEYLILNSAALRKLTFLHTKTENTWEQIHVIKIWFWIKNQLWMIIIAIVMSCGKNNIPTHTDAHKKKPHIYTLVEAKRLSLCQASVHLRISESHATVSHRPHLIHYDYRLKYSG